MNIDEALLKAARKDMVIGLCSVCHLEVRWSKARQWPLTAPPVHADCCMERDDRTRTPPHGDALLVSAATRRAMAGPELPHNEAGMPITDQRAFDDVISGATALALRPRPGVMRTGHIDPTVPFAYDANCYLCNSKARGMWACEGHLRKLAVPAQPQRPLPSHIERAASQAYAAGHDDGASCGCGRFIEWDEARGVDAFRESLERDAAEAVSAAQQKGEG